MMLKKLVNLFILSSFITSCSQFLQNTQTDFQTVISKKSNLEHFSIVHSHNLNGETQPCGCRQNPLGGIENVAGVIHELNSKDAVVYIDTGDAFFPSTNVPKVVEKSQYFMAETILNYYNQIGLHFFTPGDQDFAAGEDYLAELLKQAKFEVLLANYTGTKIKTSKTATVRKGNTTLYCF